MKRFGTLTSAVVVGSMVCGSLSGCTHLHVTKYNSQGISNKSGYVYMLDFTQYDIVLNRTLVSCNKTDAPTIKIEAVVTPTLAPDGEQVYVIDPESMISAFKTSDISIDYKEGRLVGFNAATVDKTGEFIASVATTAGKIAALSSGIPLPVKMDGTRPNFCSDDAERKLATVKQSKTPLLAIAAQLEVARSKLAVITAQFAANPTEKHRAQIANATQTINKAQKQADALVKESSEAQAWLTDSMTVIWPQSSLVFASGPAFGLSAATRSRWFNSDEIRKAFAAEDTPSVRNEGTTRYLRNEDSADSNSGRLGISAEAFRARYPNLNHAFDVRSCPDAATCAQLDQLTKDLDSGRYELTTASAISLHLAQRGSYGSSAPQTDTEDERAGLRYRMPAAGWLYICEHPQTCIDGGKDQPIAKVAGAIAQLGTVFNIPFSSPAFASGSVVVKFDEQGRLLHAGLKRDNATALDMATAAGSVVDQATSYAKAKQNAPLAEAQRQTALAKARKELADAEAALEKSPTDKLNEELALLEAQAKVDAARAALAPSRSKDLTNELAIARLEADLAETRARYAADPQADMQVVKDQYDAQTAVLDARRAALEAEAAVLEAERALAATKKP